MNSQLQHIIEEFNNRKVLVIGDAILDTYIKGTTDRLCREAPVPVIDVQDQEHHCGGAANTAINVAALGAETFFLTIIGKDDNSQHLLQSLRKNNVQTGCVIRDKERTTIAKKRIMASSSILLRVDEGKTDPVNTSLQLSLNTKLEKIYPSVDAIILSDYGYGIITESLMQTIAKLRQENPKPLIIDSRDLAKFKSLHPTAVKPNYEETLKLLNLPKADPSERVNQVQTHAKKLLDVTGAQCVAATMDVDGAFLFEKGKKPYHIMAVPRDNKNSIGAGDTFISAMTLAFASGCTGKTAAEIGAAAAAVVMQKEGTVVCTNHELLACFYDNPKHVFSLEALATQVQEWKKEGKQVVFTNGCFDILHIGHVSLLNKAKELGDILIVGINSDESIRRVKGNDRPINSLEDRIAVVSALQCVDYLVPFNDDTASALIQALHPDYFVKGASYTVDSLPEAPLVEQLGGQVKIFPLFSNQSTGQLIQKIRGTAVAQKSSTKPSGRAYV